MTQSRTMSLVEAIANVAVGYGIAVVAQVVVFPLFGLRVSLADNLLIGCVFTGISLVRGYLLRRLFEALRVRESRSEAAAPDRAAARRRMALVSPQSGRPAGHRSSPR